MAQRLRAYKTLSCEFNMKRDEVKSLKEKRKLELSLEINKKVENALKVFVKQNGYLIVLDSSKINSSTIVKGESVDITKDFIQFYNKQFVNKETQ